MFKNIIKVATWGNSFGIRINKSIADKFSLQKDSELEVIITDDGFFLKPTSKADKTHIQLQDSVSKEYVGIAPQNIIKIKLLISKKTFDTDKIRDYVELQIQTKHINIKAKLDNAACHEQFITEILGLGSNNLLVCALVNIRTAKNEELRLWADADIEWSKAIPTPLLDADFSLKLASLRNQLKLFR